MNLTTQKYKYDCWVAAIYNMLQQSNINIDYFDLKNNLVTTTLWWTFPKNIEKFLKKYKDINFKISVILVSSNSFYNNEEDYGHYINIIWFKNNKYTIFYPWDGLFYELSKSKFNRIMSNVLVWKKYRYNNIIFWKNIDEYNNSSK